ncbi:glycerol-3-phosphate 1-O-acyltransferase PlsY [Streptococcus caprae]|uniref:Glycerol-3-phosphate acyltransferase n=1 Tax=Streptococcus caprae TaxID=1640501 RepID=A0ABV8CUT5_9STRE
MKIMILILIAYLLGSIPTGLWIGNSIYKINLRDHGSGNTGTTNTFRILGWKAGTVTLVIDVLKGTLATLLPAWLGLESSWPLVIGFFAIIGHTYPIFAQFRGGKAVATSAGVLLGFAPAFLFFLLLIFGIMLYLYSMISLASVTAAAVALLGIAVFPALNFLLYDYNGLFSLIIVCVASIIIFRHKENIQRILKKEENTVPFGLNLSHQNKE